jgi:hypothetical protein
MSVSKSLLKNINVINIILTLGLIIFFFVVVLPSYRADVTTLPATMDKSAMDDTGVEEPPKKEVPPPSDYSVIAENNLFHPDRKLVVSKDGNQPLQEPEFVLYGTVLTGDVKVAYMEDLKSPYTTQGRGKRQRALHIGEELSGYIVSKIYKNRVVMVRGDEKIEVNLLDSTHKRETVTKILPKKQQEIQKRNKKLPSPSHQKVDKRKKVFPPNPEELKRAFKKSIFFKDHVDKNN